MTGIYHLFIEGKPQPQGSSSAFINKATGRAIVTSANPNLRVWRKTVADALESAWEGAGGTKKSEAAFSIASLEFLFSRPANRKKEKRHRVKPDLDKLVRAFCDSASTAGIWKDDSRVANLTARKRYVEEGETPGVRVTLEELIE